MSVVVTGAAGGIGAACVKAFQARGSHVVGVDTKPTSEADEHLVIDLYRETCGQELADALRGQEIETLVNNAATALYMPAVDTQVASWDETLAVNLRAPFLVSVALYPALKAADGSVVNVSSVHAMATSAGVAAYAASKGGLVSLSRALAVEWAPEVRVNSVLPGAVDTQMLADGLFRSGRTVEELGAEHPMQRVASPDDVAAAVTFLAQSNSITGASLLVDCGATARLSVE